MSWAEDLEAACQAQIERLHNIVNESSILVTSELHKRTPVDTTNAQNSWYLSPGYETYVQFNGRAVGRDPVAEARAVLANNRLLEIFVTNSEDYIQKLEWGMPGGSSQAPAGFMHQTVAAWPHIVAYCASRFKAQGWT